MRDQGQGGEEVRGQVRGVGREDREPRRASCNCTRGSLPP